jgi:hypothetical protein
VFAASPPVSPPIRIRTITSITSERARIEPP